MALGRGTLAPLLPVVLRRRRLVAEGVRTLSQLRIGYRHSPLSVPSGASPGGPRPGDRLPDATTVAAGRPVRLHDLVARPGVHVFAPADGPPWPCVDGPRVQVHRVSGWPGTALVVVRPDGYVGPRAAPGHDADLLAGLSLAGAAPR